MLRLEPLIRPTRFGVQFDLDVEAQETLRGAGVDPSFQFVPHASDVNPCPNGYSVLGEDESAAGADFLEVGVDRLAAAGASELDDGDEFGTQMGSFWIWVSHTL